MAVLVRLYGLGERSITHPEIYVPGIHLIEGISEPPPRHDLAETVHWHFHDEPHPMGWYLAMFGWTEVAGTSEWALRFPGVILAAASVLLVFSVGRLLYGTPAGLLAAGFLALNGFHVFWSQTARMYVAGAFLGLLATRLLLEVGRRQDARDRARPWVEVAYVLTCLAGVQTVELFWPFLFLHVAWVGLTLTDPRPLGPDLLTRPHRQGPRILEIQAVTLCLAAPALLHAVYRGRSGAAPDPDLGFLTDYATFGFLFARDDFAIPALSPPIALALPLLLLGLLAVGASLRAASAYRAGPVTTGRRPPAWLAPGVAVASALFMLWLASIAHRRQPFLAAMAILPVAALTLPALTVAVRSGLARIGPVERALHRVAPGPLLMWLLAVAATLILYALSHVVSILAPRAFLIFVPYLLILGAAGAMALAPAGRARVLVATGLLALFAASLPYAGAKPGSPRDYKAIATQMAPLMQPGDRVLMRKRDWADTPFFYYLPDADYVVEDWAQALAETPDARVWLVTFPWEEMPVIHDARRDALAAYSRVTQISALRAAAELFVPTAAAGQAGASSP